MPFFSGEKRRKMMDFLFPITRSLEPCELNHPDASINIDFEASERGQRHVFLGLTIIYGVSENSVALNPMVLLIIIPMKNGYFIGKINPIFRQTHLWWGHSFVTGWWFFSYPFEKWWT